MMARETKSLTIFVLLISLILTMLQAASPLPVRADVSAGDRETKMGKQGTVNVEKDIKLITDPVLLDRVNKIGQAIAAVANADQVNASYGSSKVCKFEYKFKIVDDKSINAFSLPGGIVYVNKGLLDYVQSDHELAGVLAHEIAHASHHHLVYLMKEENRMDSQIALMMAIGILGKINSTDLGNLLLGAQFVRIAKTSGYGQKAENDADATAVYYTNKAGYKPVGMLTFMERLAVDHANSPQVDFGILQTHPAPRDRCRAIIAELKSLNVSINRRAVTNKLKIATEKTVINDQTVTKVVIDGNVLFEPASIDGKIVSVDRANAIATKLNQLLDAEPVLRDITLSADKKSVLVRGEPVIAVTEQDCRLQGKLAVEIAGDAEKVLKRAVWQDCIAKRY